MKKLLQAALIGSLVLAAGCGTARRAGKDLLITVGSPFVVLYGAGTDGAADAANIQKGFESGDTTQVIFFPFTFAYRLVDHTLAVALHALDLVATPFYALAELNPNGPEIRPLQIYTGTIFDVEESKEGDVETGEGR